MKALARLIYFWSPLFLCCLSLAVRGECFTWADSIWIPGWKARPEKVIKQINLPETGFHKASGNRINFGLSNDAFKYVVIKVQTPEIGSTPTLCLDNTGLDSVLIYSLAPFGQPSLIYLGGTLVANDKKPDYVWHTVKLPKANPGYYLVAVKAAQKNINIRYDLLSEEQLRIKYQLQDRVFFFYFGVVCLISIIATLAFFLFKKWIFAAYVLYILFTCCWVTAHYGYLYPYCFPKLARLNEIVKPFSSLAAGYFLLKVMQYIFANQLRTTPRFVKLIATTCRSIPPVIFCVLLLVVSGLSPVIRWALIAIWHLALLLTFCIIIITPFVFRKSGSTSKILLIAMLTICIAAFLQIASNSGIIDDPFLGDHAITLGSLLENIIIALGVFHYLLLERKQREQQVIALETEQGEILKRLILVQDRERKRIAGDLHDNIGPLLAALKINFNRIIQNKEEENGLILKTEAIIDDSISEIRSIAHNLMPKGITSKGLINALQDYFESMETLYQKRIVYQHNVKSIFQAELQIHIYRIICELVLNALKHSEADTINVSLTVDYTSIGIKIKDNGLGFQAAANGMSIGLQNAESRVTFLGGRMSVNTGEGKGTAIYIILPLQRNNT